MAQLHRPEAGTADYHDTTTSDIVDEAVGAGVLYSCAGVMVFAMLLLLREYRLDTLDLKRKKKCVRGTADVCGHEWANESLCPCVRRFAEQTELEYLRHQRQVRVAPVKCSVSHLPNPVPAADCFTGGGPGTTGWCEGSVVGGSSH